MTDAEYLVERAQQELKAAVRTLDQRVRLVHLELADAYTFRIQEMSRIERNLQPIVSPDEEAWKSTAA
jgi:hypothetical protein